MTGKVLVACGTTNGSTAQIAEAVANVLREDGFEAQAAPGASVGDVSEAACWNEVPADGVRQLRRPVPVSVPQHGRGG